MDRKREKKTLVLCTAPVTICIRLLGELRKDFPEDSFVLFASRSSSERLRTEFGMEVVEFSGKINPFNSSLHRTLITGHFSKVVYLYADWFHDNIRLTLLYAMSLYALKFTLYQKTAKYLKEDPGSAFFRQKGARSKVLRRLLTAVPVYFFLSVLNGRNKVRFFGFNGSYGDIILESYYLYVDMSLNPNKKYVCYFQRNSDNAFLVEKVRETVPVRAWGRQVHELSQMFGKQYCFSAPMYDCLQSQAIEKGPALPPQVIFSDAEENHGKQMLDAMGLTEEQYVLVHSRDTRYFHQYYGDLKTLSTINSENSHRDADFTRMLSSAKTIEKTGLKVVRYGRDHAELDGEISTRVYDYPNSPYRSDFMDFYLASKCRFLIGSCSGAANVTYMFNRPFLFLNLCNLFMIARRKAVVSHLKSFSDAKTGRRLSLVELCEMGLHERFFHASEYADRDVVIRENTEDELQELTLEMLGRLSGTWADSPQDEAARRKFDSIYLRYKHRREPEAKIYAPISTTFLRRNPEFYS